MSPQYFVTQLEILFANGAQPARIRSVLFNLRKSIDLLEVEVNDIRRPSRKGRHAQVVRRAAIRKANPARAWGSRESKEPRRTEI
jgi:hypothetical protein